MTAKQKVIRKLRAIMSADVKGYSLLMADDEVATVQTLKDYRHIMSAHIEDHGGRVVDAVGDNLLAEFDSAVDAVECAVEVQKELKAKNQELPQDKRLEFRIGVNIGDVIQDGDSIFGDGVNIAARIESLADAGGVCVSRNVYNHIKKKLSLGFEFLGEHPVKNISEPVTVYRVLMDEKDAGKLICVEKKASKRGWYWATAAAVVVVVIGLGIWQFFGRRPAIEPASEEKMAYPLPDKPSIAVLPFDNISNEKEQEYFCDGLSEGIINALAKNDRLLVIARNSTFAYKGKPTNVKQIAEDLGIRYVLEGSIQKAGDQVRVTAQLIDALSGYHLFSERYDRELKDIFRVQDEITKKVFTAVLVKLATGEAQAYHEKGTDNLDAYLKVMQARDYKNSQFTKERVLKAMQLFEEAIAMDPEYALAYSYMATAYFDLVILGASDDPKKSLRTAIELGNKAIALDESNPSVHANLAFIYIAAKNFDKAFEEAEKAISIAPNSAAGYFALGFALVNTGQFQEAIPALEKCLRLSPIPVASHVLVLLGNAYRHFGRYEEAITTYKKALRIFGPDQIWVHINLAGTYALMDLEEEARAAAAEVMRIDPDFSIARFLKPWPVSQAYKDRMAAALRKAGLPDEPPLPLPDKPSIAVLAFDNLSGDPEQEYFSDGIAENIITALSKVGELFVIARNSSFTYKGKPVKVQQISRELGVRYVLEGSVQKSGERVRIAAQLIDAKNGQHLWAENYDRDFKDMFEIQDEITKKIVSSLRIKLTEGEQARILENRIKNPDVHLKVIQGLSLYRKGTKESLIRYGQIAQEIVDMEPEVAVGYRMRAWYHKGLADLGISRRENINKAFEMAQKALSIDESDGFSHSTMGSIYSIMGEYEKAIASGKRSVELQPNGAMVHLNLGTSLNFAGSIDEGIAHIKQAIRLNPFPAYYYYYNLGRCYLQKGQYEQALTEFKKAQQRAPDNIYLYMILAINYILLDRSEEARAAATKALEINPNISVTRISKLLKYKNQSYNQLLADAMRKAGFPD